jgi:DNA polymerase-3 subunit gamma/tau
MEAKEVEFYKKYRPKLIKEVVGQQDACHILKGLIDKNKVPRAILFTGPSGCGKTTLARILKDKLGCTDNNFIEQNAADFNGIEMVRDIRRTMRFSNVGGTCRIWLIDEAHELTKGAQNAFLKILEDTPKHVYFFLATTDPAKLLATIKTRCTEIKCSAIADKALDSLVRRVAESEDIELTDETVDKLVSAAESSARKALVLLHQISEIEDEDSKLTAIAQSSSGADAIELARLLCRKGIKWPEVAKLIKKINPTNEDAESIRRLILSYYNNVLLGGGVLSPRAFLIIDSFRDNFYDCGKVGLTHACYELVTGGK